MENKEKVIICGVCAMEGLQDCLAHNIMAIGIEEPLFTQIKDDLHTTEELEDYDITFPSENYALLLKSSGYNCYDPTKHCLAYIPS